MNLFMDPDAAVRHLVKTYQRGYLWKSSASNGPVLIALRPTVSQLLKFAEAGVLSPHNMHFQPDSYNLAMSQLYTDFGALTFADAIIAETKVNLTLMTERLSPGNSFCIGTKFGDKNIVCDKVISGDVNDFLETSTRGEIEAINLQMKEAKIGISRLMGVIKPEVDEMVSDFANEWEQLPDLEDIKKEMQADPTSSKAFQMTDEYVNEYLREGNEPLTSGDLREQ